MNWNHRVFKEIHNDEEHYSIREVYYDDNGIPITYTVEEIAPNGETVEYMRATLKRMIACLDHPVLQDSDFVGSMKDI